MELVNISSTVQSNWKELNLGDSAILKARIGWQGLTTAEYLDTGNYYLITGTDFKNGFIDWDNCVFVEKNRYDQDRNIQVQVGDVLVTKDGTIGKVAFVDKVPKPTTLNSGVFVIRPKNKAFDTKYFYYVLMSNHFADFLSRLTAGSTISHLYQKDFVHFNFPLPPLPEQKAIAQVLSDIDNLIQVIEKKLAKKRAIKQGTMQKLLTPKEDWERVRLDNVIEVNRGGSPRPIQDYITTSPNGINWIKIGDTTKKGKYISSTKEKIIPEGIAKSRKVNVGDFLLSNSMSFGRPYILKIDGCIHDGWLVLQNYQDSFDREFLYYTLMSKDIYNQYLTKASGSGVLNLNKELVKTVELNKPKSLKEQIRIATILSDMDAEIAQLEQKLSKYKMVKQGLMQNLLTAKIRLI